MLQRIINAQSEGKAEYIDDAQWNHTSWNMERWTAKPFLMQGENTWKWTKQRLLPVPRQWWTVRLNYHGTDYKTADWSTASTRRTSFESKRLRSTETTPVLRNTTRPHAKVDEGILTASLVPLMSITKCRHVGKAYWMPPNQSVRVCRTMDS